jgi:hypothetical protein
VLVHNLLPRRPTCTLPVGCSRGCRHLVPTGPGQHQTGQNRRLLHQSLDHHDRHLDPHPQKTQHRQTTRASGPNRIPPAPAATHLEIPKPLRRHLHLRLHRDSTCLSSSFDTYSLPRIERLGGVPGVGVCGDICQVPDASGKILQPDKRPPAVVVARRPPLHRPPLREAVQGVGAVERPLRSPTAPTLPPHLRGAGGQHHKRGAGAAPDRSGVLDGCVHVNCHIDVSGATLQQLLAFVKVVLQVLTLVVSRIGHQVMENKWKASKIILNGPVELIRHDLRLLLMKMESWESFVSAAGYFALDYSFFLSLLAAVASYIVILLQL